MSEPEIAVRGRHACFADICERIDYGFTASADFSIKQPRLLRITDIQNGAVEWNMVPGCTITPKEEDENRLVPGDIVFARTGATAGKSFLIRHAPRDVFASYLIRMRMGHDVLPKYFAYFCQSQPYWQQIDKELRGSTQGGVNSTLFGSLVLPVPDLAEQKRIAAILERADRLRRLRRYAVETNEGSARSPFVHLFVNANRKNWRECELGDVCDRVIDCPHATPTYSPIPTPYPCVRSSDIQNCYLDLSLAKYVDASQYETRVARGCPLPGDVIYCREGARFGNAARVLEATKLCLGQRMMLFRPNSKMATPEYVWGFLCSDDGYRQATRALDGSASPHVNIGEIIAFRLPLPPLSLQSEFGALLQRYDRHRNMNRESLRQTEHCSKRCCTGPSRSDYDETARTRLRQKPSKEAGSETKEGLSMAGNSHDSASDRLSGIWAKIERGKYHTSDLESRINAFREANPKLLSCEQEPKTGDRIFGLRQELPLEFSLIVGDSVHNLRSALDHLACRLVAAHSDKSIDRVSFPICDKPDIFKDKRTAQKINGVSPGARDLIEAVQPYQAGYELLLVLSKLDNIDKHQIVLVVAYGVQQFGFSYRNDAHPALQDAAVKALVERFRSQTIEPAGVGPTESLPMLFQGGAELARISWPDGPPVQMDQNQSVTYEIAFAEPEIVKGKAVVPLLHQLADFVEEIVNQFVSFL